MKEDEFIKLIGAYYILSIYENYCQNDDDVLNYKGAKELIKNSLKLNGFTNKTIKTIDKYANYFKNKQLNRELYDEVAKHIYDEN